MKVLLSHTLFLGSLYHRMHAPAQAVREAFPDLEVEVVRGLTTTMVQRPGDEELSVGSVDARGADVVVVQLPKTEAMLQCLRLLQAQGIAVVVEMDDLLSAVPFGHGGHTALVRSGAADIARQCAAEADFLTVSTPALLQEYGRHGRGMVVPNAVPRHLAELPPAYERDPEVLTVGWTGAASAHPYDLQTMESGLQQALDRTRGRSRFTIFGQADEAKKLLGLAEEPGRIDFVQDVEGYLTAVGEHFDIGIAPLRIDRFNTSKSWLKVLEYAARGVYAVRAPSAEYDRLGLGRRARRPRDWAQLLTRALTDADHRREAAARDREQVLAGHLTEHTAPMWVDAWRRARDHRSRADRIGA
ncbi:MULTISPECIES: glycosyltransferase family protein [unclassified Blastococcus]